MTALREGSGTGSAGGGKELLLTTLPLLALILRPPFRPLNAQLYSARERAELAELVSVMLQFNLTYRQQRSPDGQYVYLLEP